MIDLPLIKRRFWRLTVLFVGLISAGTVYLLMVSRLSDKAELFVVDTTSRKPTPLKTSRNISVDSTTMEYVYNAPESGDDIRYQYQWEILKTALEKTKKEYGSYRLVKSQQMSEKRQVFELKNSTNEITVMYLSTTPEMEKDLLPIRIPVDKNLAGYFVMLIRKEDQAEFNRIRTMDELKKKSIGLGYGWIDVEILRANNFKVVTGSTYEGLFKMVANKRFDAFARSAVEILDEYEARKEVLNNIEIEDSLLLYYPLPMYFWFSKTERGELLADRAKKGMEIMIKDGSYDQLFYKYHGDKTRKLNLKGRRIFKIDNPLLVPETPFEHKHLWYNPIK